MPGIPADITIAGRTPATIKGNLPPLINTLASARGGLRAGDDSGGGGGGSDPVGIIFESNFGNDTGLSITSTSGGATSAIPSGFDGVVASGDTGAEVLPVGPAGKNALRIKYDPALSQPSFSLSKALVPEGSGFSDIYFRYNLKFPDNFKFGDGTSTLAYWKWFRLAQNFDINDTSTLTENRPDSYYVVGNISSSPTWGTRFNITAAGNEEDGTVSERSAGSSGGPRAVIDWYDGISQQPADRRGHFTAMQGWDIDWDTNKGRFKTYGSGTSQEYHTLEIRVKAASSPGADDGLVELFFDGVGQGASIRISDKNAPDTGPFTGLPTAENPHGWNLIQFFDNMTSFNSDYALTGVDGWVDLADVVVSTERIGHSYIAGNS